MATNRSIFGLRFGSNPELNPASEELQAFLKNTKKPGSREVHGKDLVRYSELLEGLAAFEDRFRSGAGSLDPRQKMFYGVLDHSRFVSPGLMLAVVQYKYHLHNLVVLDFKKPAAFIKTAEEEGKKLNPKKKDDAAKLARLQGMVEERKGALVGLKKRQQALADELLQIGRYVRDNLVQIVKLCKASIVILVEVQVSGTMEARLIKDMTEDFKAQLRAARANGGIAQEQLDVVSKDVAALSREISGLVRDDVYSITRLYEAIHEHASDGRQQDRRPDDGGEKNDPTEPRRRRCAVFEARTSAPCARFRLSFRAAYDLSLERDRIRAHPPGKAKRDAGALFRPLEQGAQGPQRPQDWRRAKEIQ